MIVSHIEGLSVLSELNLPHVKQQIQEESTTLTRAITSQERRKTYQDTVFCGRKICAQTTSLLCCPFLMTCVCLCNFSSVCPNCSYQLVQRRGGWRQWLSVECSPAPTKPAEDIEDLCAKFVDPTACCCPCQEPAIHYSTPTERSLYQERATLIDSLKTQKSESSRIKEFFDVIDPIAPPPVQQIMIEYAVTAIATNQSDKKGKPTYKLQLD